MDDLIEHAKRRAGVLSASSAWGHDDDAALINQLLARIAELEDERDLWKQSEATCCARYDKMADEVERLREALRWALAELNGTTRYDNDEQHESAFAMADAALRGLS